MTDIQPAGVQAMTKSDLAPRSEPSLAKSSVEPKREAPLSFGGQKVELKVEESLNTAQVILEESSKSERLTIDEPSVLELAIPEIQIEALEQDNSGQEGSSQESPDQGGSDQGGSDQGGSNGKSNQLDREADNISSVEGEDPSFEELMALQDDGMTASVHLFQAESTWISVAPALLVANGEKLVEARIRHDIRSSQQGNENKALQYSKRRVFFSNSMKFMLFCAVVGAFYTGILWFRN